MKFLDSVRKRPTMYIGNTDDGSGLHQMVHEVVSNAIGEASLGHAALVTVTLNAEGSLSVTDNGFGMSTAINQNDDQEPKRSFAECALTELLNGRKPVGVGLSVVNALSSKLVLKIHRDGKTHLVSFTHGVSDAPLAVIGDSDGKRGTELTFTPSPATFIDTRFDFATLESRLRELATLNPGVRIALSDQRGMTSQVVVFHFDSDLRS